MRTQLLVASALLCAVATFAQTEETYTAKITVRVVDESGKPITNVPVVSGDVDYFKSSGFHESVYRDITVHTDEHGLAVITAPRSEQELDYSVTDFPGYYTEGKTYTFETATMDNWQPWNPSVELVLKAIGVQVPGYSQEVLNLVLPAQEKPLGYDLMVGDWVAPYGKGETPDFIFQWDIRITNYLTLKFSNDGDGIQFVASTGGGLPLPRLAPSGGYEPRLIKWKWIERGTNNKRPFVKGYSNYRADANYFFRVRTKRDLGGEVVSALYGKFMGDFSQNLQAGKIDLNYCLNPEPNSRNMEFDPKRNLIGKPPPPKEQPILVP